MLSVKDLITGEIRTVTNNVAHGLIHTGKAILVRDIKKRKKKILRPRKGRGYKTKGR